MWNPTKSLNETSSAARKGACCAVNATPEQVENRGMAWIIGAFLICPCHLPLTLWLAATLLSGTAAGALLLGYPYVAGAVITIVWLTATWRGIRHLQAARQMRAQG